MNNPSQKDRFPFRWFRWVPPVITFIGALVPVVLMLFYIIDGRGSAVGYGLQIVISLFLLIVPSTSLAYPILGGILGFAFLFIVYIGYAFFSLSAGSLSAEINTTLSVTSVFLIIGSVLSIIYGIVRWRWQRDHKEVE